MTISRRNLLSYTAFGAAASLTASQGHAVPRSVAATHPRLVQPHDNAYKDLSRGANGRWLGQPEAIAIPTNAQEALQAVQSAVGHRRLAARAGGHCYENFGTEGVALSINLRELRAIEFDEEQRTFALGAGALLGDVYGSLYRRWGVTIPGGTCPSVGLGGHVPGGGYGALSRRHGLIIDHLAGLEIVVVDESGHARLEVVRREDVGPKQDLWWAHTGGGPGQLGLVTRYFFASPQRGGKPEETLPLAPSEIYQSSLRWAWETLTEEGFKHLVSAYCDWFVQNGEVTEAHRSLFSQLRLQPVAAGGFEMMTQIDCALEGAKSVLNEFEAFVGAKCPPAAKSRIRLSWLKATTETIAFSIPDTTRRFKGKSAYMKRGFSEQQLNTLYRKLGDKSFRNPAMVAMISSYGGAINTISPDATASFQRSSHLKINYIVFWDHIEDDDLNLSYLRDLYATVYARTGGVPVHDPDTAGCYIGYPDTDLQSLEWNRSNVSYKDLYWGTNLERLANVKHQWDPLNIFTHAQGFL